MLWPGGTGSGEGSGVADGNSPGAHCAVSQGLGSSDAGCGEVVLAPAVAVS